MLTKTTTDLIYSLYENTPNTHRAHLGASRIGLPCERALWYEFRWCDTPSPSGQIKRLFQTGHREEARIIDELRDAGVEVRNTHPKNPNQQIRFADKDCPHFSGSVDGVGKGFIEDPENWHIIEIKTSNKKKYDDLVQSGVMRAKYEHYCQMQMYMHWSHIPRAYYIAVCKDNDAIYHEIVAYNETVAKELTEKAHRIIYADTPPERDAKRNKDYPPCLWCDYKKVCYGEKCAEVNCRTCAHSSPNKSEELNKGFNCKHINVELLMEGAFCCKSHIFIPDLVPLECCGADDGAGTISYVGQDCREIINGPGHTSSSELREMINNDKR